MNYYYIFIYYVFAGPFTLRKQQAYIFETRQFENVVIDTM